MKTDFGKDLWEVGLVRRRGVKSYCRFSIIRQNKVIIDVLKQIRDSLKGGVGANSENLHATTLNYKGEGESLGDA